VLAQHLRNGIGEERFSNNFANLTKLNPIITRYISALPSRQVAAEQRKGNRNANRTKL